MSPEPWFFEEEEDVEDYAEDYAQFIQYRNQVHICSVQVYPGISSTGIRYDKLDLTPEHCMKALIEDWMFMCSIGLVILKV